MTAFINKVVALLLASLLLVITTAVAQQDRTVRYIDTTAIRNRQIQKTQKKPPAIQKEFSLGARLNTDGWSLFAEKGKVRSEEKESDLFYHIRMYQMEFGEHYHAKEMKMSNTNGPSYTDKPRAYKYGKVNNFYVLKLGYGVRRLIAGKPDPGTVSIHWVYAGGLSLCFLKPYYLDVVMENGVMKSIHYDEEPQFFLPSPANQMRIIGRSNYFEGINKTKMIPGIYAKTGLHFDVAAFRKRKLAIETGLGGELYIKKIPIMANVKAYPYVLNAYLSFQFGYRK